MESVTMTKRPSADWLAGQLTGCLIDILTDRYADIWTMNRHAHVGELCA